MTKYLIKTNTKQNTKKKIIKNNNKNVSRTRKRESRRWKRNGQNQKQCGPESGQNQNLGLKQPITEGEDVVRIWTIIQRMICPDHLGQQTLDKVRVWTWCRSEQKQSMIWIAIQKMICSDHLGTVESIQTLD